jgi:hypothetical protein
MITKRLAKATVAIVALYLGILICGTLSREEIHYSLSRFPSALRSARNVTDRCLSVADARIRLPIISYLTVEEYFRPAYLRKIEYWLSSLDSFFGTRFIRTIGVGQISLQTYLTARPDDQSGDETERRRWITNLRDDCQNVAVLQEYAAQQGLQCASPDVFCSLLHACFWHTGRRDRCMQNTSDNDYFENIVTAHFAAISASDFQQVAPHRFLIGSDRALRLQ